MAVSWTSTQGKLLGTTVDFTIGTNAPSAGDFEIRFNLTNAGGKNIELKDVILFLEGSIRILQQGGATVGISQGSPTFPGATGVPPPSV